MEGHNYFYFDIEANHLPGESWMVCFKEEIRNGIKLFLWRFRADFQPFVDQLKTVLG